jgi:hypothetical protein
VRAGAVGANAARKQLERVRTRNMTILSVVSLRAPQLLAELVAMPIEIDGRVVGPATPEELSYIGRQAALSEEQVGRARRPARVRRMQQLRMRGAHAAHGAPVGAARKARLHARSACPVAS